MSALSRPPSRIARVLIEPAPGIADIGEQRRARLMATLELVQLVQFLVSGIVVALTERDEGAMNITFVLLGAVPCTAITYVLTRSRHAQAGILAHVALNMALTPLIPFVDRSAPDGFLFFAFIVPGLLVTNVVTSARTTLIAGGCTLAATVMVTKFFGPERWADDIRHGIIFVTIGLTLIVVFGIHRDRLEAARSNELRARNVELEALRCTLELRVEERTRALTQRNAEMRLVLDNVAEGLFAIDRSGVISSEPSAAFTSWFGRPACGESFVSFLGRHAPQYGVAAEVAWQQVVDDMLPLDLALEQMPHRLTVGDRQYSVAFEPIGDDERKLLVVVTDITSAIAHENILRERREGLALFEHIISDRSHFLASFEEASTLVARALDPKIEPMEFLRVVHTIKGNALLLGLESVAAACHDLESLTEEDGLPSMKARAGLETRWGALKSEVDRLLGERRHTIELTLEQHDALERAVLDARPYDELLRMVVDFRLEPVGPRLRSFAEQTQRIATRLGKVVTVDIEEDAALRIDGAKWAPLWAAFVHAVRNAIDHGIEPPIERLAVGKPDCGRIVLHATRTGDSIAVEIRDDGRGMDWDRIRERAAERGAEVDSEEAVRASLFAGGVSTAREVTDISGRGIGMSALSAVVRDLGGTLRLDSAVGAGTRVRLVLPSPSPAVQARRPSIAA